jgi:hypothetical protein
MLIQLTEKSNGKKWLVTELYRQVPLNDPHEVVAIQAIDETGRPGVFDDLQSLSQEQLPFDLQVGSYDKPKEDQASGAHLDVKLRWYHTPLFIMSAFCLVVWSLGILLFWVDWKFHPNWNVVRIAICVIAIAAFLKMVMSGIENFDKHP